jgi:hypothetical protein
MRARSVRLNFAALVALSALVFIWTVLSPIWLPLVAWVVSFLLPVFGFVCKVLLVLTSLLIFGFALAVISLLLGGTIPSSRGF